MQTVSAAFSAESVDSVRKIAHNLQISWHKETNLNSKTFTIGTSMIGGNDIIGINSGALGGPGIYNYFDESDFVTSLAWERGLSLPTGGMNKAMAEATLDNTSGRFLPRYMGGHSEIYTAVLPRRPVIINAGFEFGNVPQTIAQFAGILSKTPQVDKRTAQVSLQAVDYVDFFQNRFLDQTIMFTAQRTDQVLVALFEQQGMVTAQYEVDYGINIIPFGLFESGTRFSEAIQKIVEAENGQFYQDEQGIFRFENRQHWDSAPHNQVSKIIHTAQVLDAKAPDTDHIINIVEVSGTPREKQANQLVWQSSGFAGSGVVSINPGDDYELWVSFDDPMLNIDEPTPNNSVSEQTSFYVANSQDDGFGDDVTSSVSVKHIDKFSTAAKIIFSNNGTIPAYIVNLNIWGRPARRTGNVYYRSERGLSVTAYEERPLVIANEFIQSQSWAQTYGEMILRDFAFPENLQTITIRSIPQLQIGDLVSWQGRYWFIYHMSTKLNPNEGFITEMDMVQRTITTYFKIGISIIGGNDIISS